MTDSVLPTPRQLEFHNWELGLFLHFGVRTFNEGHLDWDDKPMSADSFMPTQFDPRQWAAVARQAGMKYAVLTAKHHDGFANWPSKCTEFSVASSPWKNGRGDVIAEYMEAFRAEGLAVGLYYSPAQWTGGKFKADPKAYDDFFLKQVSELMGGQYGQIDLVWFDGCGSDGHQYDWPRLIGEMRRMQPNLLIFNMGDPDMRWIGNEEGFAPLPVWNTLNLQDVPGDPTMRLAGNELRYLPAECDCRLRGYNWFYSDKDEHTVKPLDVLMGMYYCSVGRGCNLLINVGPDRRGLLPDADANRLIEFGAEVRRRFGTPVATLKDFEQTEPNVWSFKINGLVDVDHAIIQEDLAHGQHVKRFRIEFPVPPGIPLYEGQTIGHKAICQFPLVRRNKMIFRVLEADGPVRLRSLELHDSRMKQL
ncbi:MAG: alpha-L-fucosidase [Planctomycetaceae bacterium]|nr:alpha-L-fucosidase [Planctomycetaceae bacterium]